MITAGTKVRVIGNGGFIGLPEGDTGIVVRTFGEWGYDVAFDNYTWDSDDIVYCEDGVYELCMFREEVEVYGG